MREKAKKLDIRRKLARLGELWHRGVISFGD